MHNVLIISYIAFSIGNLFILPESYFHPWEFSARLREPAFGVPGYLTHCSGTDLQRKFIRLLEWLKARGCRFLTTREYLGCDE